MPKLDLVASGFSFTWSDAQSYKNPVQAHLVKPYGLTPPGLAVGDGQCGEL